MNKHDFIILIGSDGSGKTTLAEKLHQDLGYPIHHFGPPKDYEDGKQTYFDFVEKTNQSVICDRFHEGEQIFAPLYRGYEADYFEELEEKLREKFNVVMILVTASYETVKERLKTRGEDFVKEEDWKYCYEKVNRIFDESNLPRMQVDTTKKSSDHNLRRVTNMLDFYKGCKFNYDE